MRLDDNAHHNATFAEQAHDFYEHAKDLTLNEKASLLEEGEQLSLWDRFLTSIHRYIIEPIGTARRFLYLAILFLPVIVTAPILALELLDDKQSPSYSRRRKNRKYQERTTTRWWYRFLVHQMERAGPTFIKLAQWAGSRRDLFPDILCDMFGRLHSNGKAHSLKYTKRVLEKAFKRPFDEIFIEFDPKPMGIGAIAQAYKAVLHPDLVPVDYLGPKFDSNASVIPIPGAKQRDERDNTPSTEVAIKVLHPHVEKIINRDLKIMGFFAKILNAFPGMEWLSFPQEVEVFGSMMTSQLDLKNEANNLLRFEDNFRHRTVVSFPRPLMDYTSQRVLVEEYEDAVPLKAFLREGGGPYDYRIASLGLDAFLEMLLLDNFVHADLHPGNIMVKFYKPSTRSILKSLWSRFVDKAESDQASRELHQNHEISQRLRDVSHDHDKWIAELNRLENEGYQPEIVLLDTGLVTELDDENRRNFIELFRAVAEFDGYKAGRLMVERCKSPELVVDDETFALKIQHLVLSVKSRTFSLAQIKISDILSEVLQAVRTHHVRLEGDFINTVLSILLLEGIGRQLDPDMDLFKGALPILRQLGKQVGTAGSLKEGVESGSLFPMLKIWLYMEAREFAQIAVSEVDDLVLYDNLTKNI
ncbi:ABC1-domain-containing protein [Cystobasidium minutum MCA 4210]|uniref:ABC1-domain-containing protein n=1 Tax=Cystobasidium minutum MCA 4210 TaxID=1397322 RepID=UPI0034CD17F1|eukprot:jgi/Rhomi1/194985/gm1.3199_g